MLFEQITDEWGGVLAIPTTRGQALITGFMAILFLCAVMFMQLSRRKVTIQKMTIMILLMVVGTVLANIKIYSFDSGGSITLFSMLAITLVGYWFGLGAGLTMGMAYGLFNMIIDPYMVFPTQVLVDYVLAFGALGLSGVFSRFRRGLIPGYLLGVFGRFVFAVISGWLFFGEYAWEGWHPFTYSCAYNGMYLGAEAAITVVVLLFPPIRKALVNAREAFNSDMIIGKMKI